MYELAPSTHRSAKLLSRTYGYRKPSDVASSLPSEAVVADFGSGFSKFGINIATRRPDILWLNIDPIYTKKSTHKLQSRAPENIRFLADSVLDPEDPLAEGSIDRVFSTALLPHIEFTSHELALTAFHNMATLLKEDGVISVGGFTNYPNVHLGFLPNKTFSTTAEDYHLQPDLTAELAISAVKVAVPLSYLQRGANVAGHYMRLNTQSR